MTSDHHHHEQAEIEALNDEQYSLFLAYGDTFNDSPPESTGKGSDQFWEAAATRLLKAAEREELLFGKHLRRHLNKRGRSISYKGGRKN